MNEKVKIPFSRPQEKNTFLFCENLNVLYFYISNIMPPLMLVLLASPPWHYLLLLFPVVVNSYVKPIGPLLSPLFLQKSNPIDFQDRSICWSVVTPFLKLSETFEKDWTGHLPKGHLILIWEAFWESPQKETLRLLKSGIRRCNTHLFLISLAHGETKRIYFHDQTVTKKSLVPFFPDHSLFSPSLM